MEEDELILNDLNNVIYLISCDLYDLTLNDEITFLELATDGFTTIVKFLDQVIWNSEDDERIYFNEDEDEDEDDPVAYDAPENREPIEVFLRRKINEVVDVISKCKLTERGSE